MMIMEIIDSTLGARELAPTNKCQQTNLMPTVQLDAANKQTDSNTIIRLDTFDSL
jgi:hypothetical protein